MATQSAAHGCNCWDGTVGDERKSCELFRCAASSPRHVILVHSLEAPIIVMSRVWTDIEEPCGLWGYHTFQKTRPTNQTHTTLLAAYPQRVLVIGRTNTPSPTWSWNPLNIRGAEAPEISSAKTFSKGVWALVWASNTSKSGSRHHPLLSN